MSRALSTVLRFTLLEAWRARLGLAAVLVALAGAGLAALIGQVAIAETRQIQAVLSAALLRLAAAALLGLFAATSHARERETRVLELLLALPQPRSVYYLGRLMGFVAVGWTLAAISLVPLLPFAPAGAALCWALSLGCELTLVAAAALFFATALSGVPPAIMALAGFYLLARAIAALQLMAASPLVEPSAWSRLLHHALDALAFVLPRLDLFAQSAWLARPGAPWAELPGVAVQAMAYAALLALAGLIDFHRRNF